MLHLVIVLGSFVSVKAFVEEQPLMQKTIDKACDSLTNTESRFNEEITRSYLKGNQTIGIIPSVVKNFMESTQSAADSTLNKVQTDVLEPAKIWGFYKTECGQFSDNLVEALDNVYEKTVYCRKTFLYTTNRWLESINNMKSVQAEKFSSWKGVIRLAPVFVFDFDSSLAAYAMIKDTVEKADEETNNKIKKLKRIRDVFEDFATEYPLKECLQKTEQYSIYEKAYVNLQSDSERCINETVGILSLYMHMKSVG